MNEDINQLKYLKVFSLNQKKRKNAVYNLNIHAHNSINAHTHTHRGKRTFVTFS